MDNGFVHGLALSVLPPLEVRYLSGDKLVIATKLLSDSYNVQAINITITLFIAVLHCIDIWMQQGLQPVFHGAF